VPNYTLSGIGGVPLSRTLTINGTAYDLSADRSWSVGTVTSVATTGPITGGTITGSGTIGITQATTSTDGYLSSTDWNTFNNKQNAITLTTTGTSGAATLVGSTLNIPQYQSVITNPVTGTGTANYVARWTSSSQIGTGVLYDNGTNVGIGFTGPFLANLHVNGSSIITGSLTVQGSPTDLQYTVINSDLDIIQGQAEANNYGTYSRLRLFRASGTIASPTTPSSGTAIGRLEFGAYNSGTATFLANAKIEASMDATTGANDLPSRLGFFTTPDGSTTMVERMRINNTGLIRIGGTTMNFSDVLNIQAGSIAFQNGYGLRFTNTLGTPYASVYSSNNNTVIKSLGTAVLIKDISGANDIITALDGGDVGIGTSNPNAKLHVNGTFISNALWTDNTSVGYWGTYSTAYGYLTWDAGFARIGSMPGNRLDFSTNGSTLAMTIATNGNIGIGTTAPANKLSISSGAFNNGATVASILNTSSTQKAHVVYDTFLIQQDDAPTLRLYETLENLSTTISSDGGLTSFATTGEMGLFVAGSSTAPGWTGLNGIQAVRIKSNGNVGIGTTNPQYKLSVVNGGSLGLSVQTAGSTVGGPQIDIYDSSRSHETVISSTDGTTVGTYIASYTNHPLLFGTNAGSSATAKMTLSTAGALKLAAYGFMAVKLIASSLKSAIVELNLFK
jgi:hypothetical protein